MVDIRSTLTKVPKERRKNPRLELHCHALVQCLNGIATVTDISLGGIFIEPQKPEIVKIGQVTDVKIKLPEEKNCIQVKVKVVSQNKRGIGCQFVDLSHKNIKAIKQCLETFSDTLPIGSGETIKNVPITETKDAIFICPQCRKKKTINVSRLLKPNQTVKVKSKCACGYVWISALPAY